MTILFATIGFVSFAGITLRFASRFSRKASYPHPAK